MRFASCASSARASPGRRSCPPGIAIEPASRIDDQRLCELGRVVYVGVRRGMPGEPLTPLARHYFDPVARAKLAAVAVPRGPERWEIST
jgi:hypothetical protein